MTLKQWLLMQQLLAPSSEVVDSQTTDTIETQADNSGDTSTETEGSAKVFTQDQVNKLIAKEKQKVKNQFKDYDELKETVTSLAEKLKTFQETTKALEQKYLETTYTSALEKAAQTVNLDVELATKHIDKGKVIFVDDKPTNLVELLQAEIERFPQLVKRQVTTPTVVTNQQTDTTPQFQLHKTNNTNGFFNGGGIRLNHAKSTG
jgi:predicted RNase H-like nuclease (RuvC/YqgF family)